MKRSRILRKERKAREDKSREHRQERRDLKTAAHEKATEKANGDGK